MLIIACALILFGLPNNAGLSPRFLQFDASLVLYPPLVLLFIAGGFAELIVGFLRAN